MASLLNTTTIERALRQLGDRLDYSGPVEILLVGGAAGMVTGVLPANRVTTDCDVMVYLPKEAMVAVELAADAVARELKLAPNWLNSDVQIRLDALPDGWKARRQWVGTYKHLRVSAVSRIDLIAMKVLAGRDQDIDDLHALKMRPDDVAFVQHYFEELESKGTTLEQIREARLLLESLEVYDHE